MTQTVVPVTTPRAKNSIARISLPNGERSDFNATVKRIELGFLQLISPITMRVNERINISFAGCRIDSRVVRSTVLDQDSYLVNVRLLRCAGFELRTEPRIPVDIPATLNLFTDDKKYQVRIADFSQSGMGIQLPINIAVGQQVCVDISVGLAVCEVRYCRVASSGFHAGLLIVEFLPREFARSTPARDNPLPASLGNVVSLIRSKRSHFIEEADNASPSEEGDPEPERR